MEKLDPKTSAIGHQWAIESLQKFPYGWTWMGVQIVQFPADMIRLQQCIWEAKPDLIIETGTRRGGSAIFFASLMRLVVGGGRVITIDVKGPVGNFLKHPFAEDITAITGSSTDPEIISRVREIVAVREPARVMVFLDSNHTAAHVTNELMCYHPFVSVGCHLIVADGIIEDMPHLNRKMNPAIAARAFLDKNDDFEACPTPFPEVSYFKDGFMRRVR
jgi:cephalosporin hydroxylase